MENKKNLTQNILKSISNTINEMKEFYPFITVPINHPKINEIIKLLNSEEKTSTNTSHNLKELDKQSDCDDHKSVITLSDITQINEKKLIIPKNAIITPMALDYIKQKNIDIIFYENE